MRILLVGASGYIGSRLAYSLTERGHAILGCDPMEPVKSLRFLSFFQGRYQALPDEMLRDADLVLWFGGHSSVGLASDEPLESLGNNLTDLIALFQRAAHFNLPVIYASSASVLSSAEEVYSLIATETRSNVYDAGKLAFDLIAQHVGRQFLGLRMATVSGWSPRMRWDVIFNAMNHSAATEGKVRVTNPSNFRSLLFLEDLTTYIVGMIDLHANGQFPEATRQIALGSWSGSIGSLAVEIGGYWGIEPEFGADTGTYSFVVSDRELRSAFPSPGDFYQSIRSRCDLFAQQNEWSPR